MHMDYREGSPLSPQQRHLWSLQGNGDASVYRAQCAVLIEGSLDRELLRAALRDVSGRYEILRTTFRRPPRMEFPLQVVNGNGLSSIEEHDWSTWSPSRQEEEIEASLHEWGRLPFDLASGPLLRLSLVILAAERHLLLVDAPSLCTDAESLRILVREVARRYSTLVRGQEDSADPAQYADLAEWHNELLESDDTAEARRYWREGEGGRLLVPKLPLEIRPSADAAFAPRCLTSSLSPELTAAVRNLATTQDVSPSAFFLACWQTLLCRLAGESELVVGVACGGRTYEGLQEALGPFAKTLPVACRIEGDLRFRDLLQRTNESAREAVEWQEYFSFEHLSRSDAGDEPYRFLPLAFEWEEAETSHSEGGANFSILREFDYFDRFTLKLACAQRGADVVMQFHYDSNSFCAEDVDRLAREFRTLVESACANPDSPVADLEVVSPDERHQLVVTFNDTRSEPSGNKCVQELFEERARHAPENTALVSGNERVTFAQLDARANQLAHHLRDLGVGPEVPVALCMDRSLEMVIAILGILKAGGAYVPLDPEYPPDRMGYIVDDSRARVLLTQKNLSTAIPAALAVDVVCVDSDSETIAKRPDTAPSLDTTARNLAYVTYTSGSTGRPKGVMVEHGGLVNAIQWIMDTLDLTPGDRCILKTPITFDAAGRELFPTLLSGGTLIIATPDGHRDPRYLAESIRDEDVSILHCVPSLLRLLVEEPAFDEGVSLRAVMCGGEALPPETVARFQSRSKARLYNVYGPTETIIDSTYWPCEERGDRSTTPIGRPIPNARVYVLDDRLRVLPIGVTGNVYIGGIGLARGYVGRADGTAEKFIPDPFSGERGARLYETGDVGRYLADGNLELLGRRDHQVQLRGFRIELGEIEGALGEHPAVRDAVVVLQEQGGGEKRLVAYVTPTGDAVPAANELRDFLTEKLPRHMVPSVFVSLGSLPLTANGKVDRKALPMPDARRPDLAESYVAPRTPTEVRLVEIWANVLGVERVGIHDDFFQLGGHSLLATQVVSRIREVLEVEVPLRRLFEAPTVAGLANRLAEGFGAAVHAPPIVPVPRDQELPLSFAQQRLWFIDQLDPGNSVYNFPAAVRLEGPLDLVALNQSLDEIVKRHEALRTTFATVEGRPVQVIAPVLRLTVPIVDLRELPQADRETEVQRLVSDEARRPFDLAEGPLIRATVIRVGENEHVGVLTMHHIVSDGWSTGILIREMAVLYEAFRSGSPTPLPELPVQYADFAHWQRQWLKGEPLDTQLEYWKRQLDGMPPFLELSTDRPRPTEQTFRGSQESLRIPKNVSAGLKDLSQQEGVTLFMTLLAALDTLLHFYTTQDDIVIGTPIANRNRLETEGLIGFFVNTLVLRTDLSGNPEFQEVLRRVRETCLGAYAHQDLPFERLVEELQPARTLNRNPLFQVMFMLQNAPLRPLDLPGMTLTPLEVDSGTTHFDLTLHVADTGDDLIATLAYNTDLFDAATMDRMLRHFGRVLAIVSASPGRHLSELPLLTEAEHRQLQLQWRTNDPAPVPPPSVQRLFEAQVDRTPEAIALASDDVQLTYGELNRRANHLAHHLRALGAGPEVPVGVYLTDSLEVVIGLLSVLKAGGTYVPLDPADPKERLAWILKDAKVPVLLSRDRLLPGLPVHDATVVRMDGDGNTIGQESAENPICSTMPEHPAYVIYTSGSTGQPKGVLVSQAAIAEHCIDVQRYYELSPGDGVLQCASFAFDVSLEEILPTLVTGARLVMGGPGIWDPSELHRTIAAHEVTVVNLPTAYWQEVAREWADVTEFVPRIRPRVFIVGGDTMLPETIDLWRRTPMRGTRLINAYGPTETTITATACDVTPSLTDRSPVRRAPIGRPLGMRETYVLDPYGSPVPVGVPGELYIGGPCLARGYLNRADLTAEKFVPNPFSNDEGARLYRTGDRVRYLPDGTIEFLGRGDRQVKIRGFRIELGEIEAALRDHPGVRETVVLVQDPSGADKLLVAYVVPAGEPLPTVTDLRGFLKRKLPDHMVPAVFVPLETLPVMPNGKVDRGALLRTGGTRLETGSEFVAPRDALETELTTLWEEVLGVRPIGVRDNFFELGGHSLAAVRLFAMIEKRLGKKIPLATVFQGATVEHLADILRQPANAAPGSSLVPIQPGGKRRPLFLIHPAGGHVFPYVHLAKGLGPDQPCYGLQAKGVEEGQEPHTRIEEMAAHYIEAIRAVQAEGPYLLAGWSMGGMVAFEMAQQLHAQGERTALLALLDTRIPTADEEFTDEDFEVTLLVDVIRYFGLSLDARDALAHLPKDALLERVFEHAKRAGLMPLDIEVSQAQPFIELCKADFRATQNYVVRHYPGRITLFKASDDLAGTPSDPTLGWSEWAAEGVDVHVAPGNHATMVYPPHVEVLARQLAACLDQVRGDEGIAVDRGDPSC